MLELSHDGKLAFLYLWICLFSSALLYLSLQILYFLNILGVLNTPPIIQLISQKRKVDEYSSPAALTSSASVTSTKNVVYMFKFVAHIMLSLCALCYILDSVGKIPHVDNRDHPDYAFCFFPAYFSLFFMGIAYNIVLYIWILAYHSVASLNLRWYKIGFCILQFVWFTLALASSLLSCTERQKNRNDYYVLAVSLSTIENITCMVVMTMGFAIYGFKIAWNLKQGSQLGRADQQLYKMTIQTAVLSVSGTICTLIALFVSFLLLKDYISIEIVKIPESLLALFLLAETAYLARPPKYVQRESLPIVS